MIALSLALLLARPVPDSADLQRIDDPVEIWAPPIVATRWNSFERLEDLTRGLSYVRIAGPIPEARGRVDVLRRTGKRWIWAATGFYKPGLMIPATDSTTGVLVRFESSAYYFWGETKAPPLGSVTLGRFKSLEITATGPNDIQSLFVASENEPRIGLRGQTKFRQVPAEIALACAENVLGSLCVAADPAVTSVTIGNTAGKESRVLRVTPQTDDQFVALQKGRIAIRPKTVEVIEARAAQWLSLTLSDETTEWDQIVVDRKGGELAMERIEGRSLLRPPSFAEVATKRERGITIRPWIGSSKRPLVDAGALMLVFPTATSELSAQIPLLTVAQNINGAFEAPSLGSGNYELKLLSSVALADRIAVSGTAGVPLDVVFRTGPTVTGRVVRTSGGTAGDRVSIEVSAIMTLAEALKGDALDRLRVATADDSGTFSVVVGLPGKYRLRAQWGSASGERDFEITPDTSTVQLGDVLIGGGSILRGSVAGCPLGEAYVIPIPNASKPMTLGFSESRHARIDSSGHFVIEGLTPGQWNTGFMCGGVWSPSSPEAFSVVDGGADVIIDFALTPPH